MQLAKINDARELDDDLLRIITELERLPAARVRRVVQQFRYGVVRVL